MKTKPAAGVARQVGQNLAMVDGSYHYDGAVLVASTSWPLLVHAHLRRVARAGAADPSFGGSKP